MAEEGNAAAKVQAVFAAVAQGDAGDTDALLALGDAIVPAVSGYLLSGDQAVRIEAVALLAALESETGAKALLPVLADSSADIRERAARAVLAQVMTGGTFAGLDRAAAKGLAAGEPGAAALLLGAFSKNSGEGLRDTVDSTRLVKLAEASLPVPAKLAAQVALSRLGDGPARSALDEAIAGGEVAELVFLLDVLPLLDDSSTISALAARTLADERAIAGDLPSGIEPSRRVADHAVDVIAARLELRLSFSLDETRRYSAAEIAEVRDALNSEIPN